MIPSLYTTTGRLENFYLIIKWWTFVELKHGLGTTTLRKTSGFLHFYVIRFAITVFQRTTYSPGNGGQSIYCCVCHSFVGKECYYLRRNEMNVPLQGNRDHLPPSWKLKVNFCKYNLFVSSPGKDVSITPSQS